MESHLLANGGPRGDFSFRLVDDPLDGNAYADRQV